MNWDAVGAVGEIAGALGVIVTLIYLALQVRHNTRASRLASFQASTELLSEVNLTIAGDDDIAGIFAKVFSETDVALTAKERIKFGFVYVSLFRAWETAYFQRQEGFALQQSWQRYEQSLHAQLQLKVVVDWWHSNTFGFTEEFRAYVDSNIEQIKAEE